MSLFSALAVRASQGRQFIQDLRSASPKGFVGLPRIGEKACPQGCAACTAVCPTKALTLDPVTLDLGRCVFCTECAAACPEQKLTFSTEPKLSASTREALFVRAGGEAALRVKAHATFSKVFGRSLKLRQVSAGGCNACELELNAAVNVNFDVQRYGIEWVASPRHADALVVTGPLTEGMREAVRLAWEAMPEPRFLVAVGACAISGGLYDGAVAVERSFLAEVGPALYVPGCPPHPLTFVNALLDFVGAG